MISLLTDDLEAIAETTNASYVYSVRVFNSKTKYDSYFVSSFINIKTSEEVFLHTINYKKMLSENKIQKLIRKEINLISK